MDNNNNNNNGNQKRRLNPMRKLKLANMRSQANGAAMGLPVDPDEDYALFDTEAFEAEFPRFITDTLSNATTNDGGQVVQGNRVIKHCEVADIDGKYITLPVWTDRCAVANFITPEAVSWLRVKAEETEDDSIVFETLNGAMTTHELVTIHWKGRSAKGSSSFYVTPEGTKVGPLVVGDGFLSQYGDDVFADLPTAAVTIASRRSESERAEQEKLRVESKGDAAMLEKKRQDEKKKKKAADKCKEKAADKNAEKAT